MYFDDCQQLYAIEFSHCQETAYFQEGVNVTGPQMDGEKNCM